MSALTPPKSSHTLELTHSWVHPAGVFWVHPVSQFCARHQRHSWACKHELRCSQSSHVAIPKTDNKTQIHSNALAARRALEQDHAGKRRGMGSVWVGKLRRTGTGAGGASLRRGQQ